MAPPIPTGVPRELAAGTTWKFTLCLADYPPAEGWTVTLVFRGPLPAPAAINATAQLDTSDYLVSVLPATTSGITAGTYQWIAYAEKAGEKFVAESGTVVVTPNLAAVADASLESNAAVMLARVRAEIKARITGSGSAHEDYTIGTAAGGRSLSKIPIDELRKLERDYAWQVWREQNPGKLGPRRQVAFRG